MPSRKVILLVIAGALLVFVMIPKKPRITAPPPPPAFGVVANRDIPPYTMLTENDVRRTQIPRDQAVDTFDQVDSRASEGGEFTSPVGLMTTSEVRAGNVLRRSELLVPDPTWVEGQMLVYSFYVTTDRIVGGQLRPGHHVDLLVTRPETRNTLAESLWLARNLWVVGVYQASGDEVLRPTVTIQEAMATEEPARGGLTFASGASVRSREGPANLVVVATHQGTAKMIGDYLGARLYDPWVYVRPGRMSPGEAFVPSGRIDGLVFEDENEDQVQERDEAGLDDVTITLYTEEGAVKSTVKTASGGKFYFDDLEPGVYQVVETDPRGYVSGTTNRQRVELVAGQNVHVFFGDQKEPPTPTATATATSMPTPTPTSTATRTPLESGKPTPTSTTYGGPRVCRCSVYMSDREDGPSQTEFPEHTKEVWVVLSFEDCGPETSYSVHVSSAQAPSEERIVASGMCKDVVGKKSIKVVPLGAAEFEPGVYATFVKIGAEKVVCDYVFWSVGVASAASNNGEQPKSFPVTGFGLGRGR